MKKSLISLFVLACSMFTLSTAKAQDVLCESDPVGFHWFPNAETVPSPFDPFSPPAGYCRDWDNPAPTLPGSLSNLMSFCGFTGTPTGPMQDCFVVYCNARFDAFVNYYNCVAALPPPVWYPLTNPLTGQPNPWGGYWYKCNLLTDCKGTLAGELMQARLDFCECVEILTNTITTNTNLPETVVVDELFYLRP